MKKLRKNAMPAKTVEKILKLYCDGKSTTEIGKIVGCHQTTASQVTRNARKAGVVGPSPRWPYAITKAQHNRVFELRAEGKTKSQIRLLTGTTYWTINRVLATTPIKVPAKPTTSKRKRPKALARPTLSDITSILRSKKPENDVLARLKKLLAAA